MNNEGESKEIDTESKIKNHIRENRKYYITAAGGVLAGVIGTIAYIVISGRLITDEDIELICKNKLINSNLTSIRNRIQGKNNRLYQTISVYGHRLGRPGKAVIDLTHGKRYESETLVAKAFGVSNKTVSDHLRGKTDSIMGSKFMFADPE